MGATLAPIASPNAARTNARSLPVEPVGAEGAAGRVKAGAGPG